MARKKENLEPQALRAKLVELFSFDNETGEFHHKVPAGHFHKENGYRYITIGGKQYLAHRLAWLYVYGEWPPQLIDHIDGNRSNNRPANLRKATYSQNAANAKLHTRNTSGIKGVSYDKTKDRWQATITVNNKQLHLGRFKTKEEAKAAYMAAAKMHQGEFANDGQRGVAISNVVKLGDVA